MGFYQKNGDAIVEEIGNGAFPTPLMIADCGEATLRQRCKLGFRSPVLMNATTELFSEHVISDSGDLRPGGISYQELLSIRGVGPYSASHVAMLEHDFSHIPVDSEVSKYCEEKYLLKPIRSLVFSNRGVPIDFLDIN